MTDNIDSVLVETANSAKKAERLLQFSKCANSEERKKVLCIIADNPDIEASLLYELAREYPNEVLENPRFKLLQVSGKNWWDLCGFPSLFALMATGKIPMNDHIQEILLEGFNDFFYKLPSNITGEVLWSQEQEVDLRNFAGNSLPAEILIRMAMEPFAGYFHLSKGDPCETITGCIELLWQLGVGGEHAFSPFSDWSAGWHLEMVGTASGGPWQIDAISPLLDKFDYSLNFPYLTISGPGDIEYQLELSELDGENEEEWRISIFNEEFEFSIGNSSFLPLLLQAL